MVDPCVLYRRKENGLEGAIILQFDDSFGFGTPPILIFEEEASAHFKHKPRLYLVRDPVRFTGMQVRQLETFEILLGQDEKIDKLEIPTGQKEFASNRSLAQYVGVNIRPGTCAPVQLIAPVNTPTTADDFKPFKKVVLFLRETKDTHLRFFRLHLHSVKLVFISDASFANSKVLKSQLGYFIDILDEYVHMNVVQYVSNRCRRVVRSVMLAEVQGLVLGFDSAVILTQFLY